MKDCEGVCVGLWGTLLHDKYFNTGKIKMYQPMVLTFIYDNLDTNFGCFN